MLVAAGVAGIVVMTSSQSALACKFMVDVIDSSSSSRSSSSGSVFELPVNICY